MKKINESAVLSFSEWWKRNESIYKKIKVTKEIAYAIWCDACDAFANGIRANA